jgi:hypothetical protein
MIHRYLDAIVFVLGFSKYRTYLSSILAAAVGETNETNRVTEQDKARRRLALEMIKILSYIVWVGLIICGLRYPNSLEIARLICPFLVIVPCFLYIYELTSLDCELDVELDLAHKVHHLLTLVTVAYCYWYNVYGTGGFVLLDTYSPIFIFLVTYCCGIVNISSVFSSLRTVVDCCFELEAFDASTHKLAKSVANNVYYVVYLISKIGAIMVYYTTMLTQWSDIVNHLTTPHKILFAIIALLHCLQLYFCRIIVRKLCSDEMQTEPNQRQSATIRDNPRQSATIRDNSRQFAKNE